MRKNLRITVTPEMSVFVKAPVELSSEMIHEKILKKILKKMIRKILKEMLLLKVLNPHCHLILIFSMLK